MAATWRGIPIDDLNREQAIEALKALGAEYVKLKAQLQKPVEPAPAPIPPQVAQPLKVASTANKVVFTGLVILLAGMVIVCCIVPFLVSSSGR